MTFTGGHGVAPPEIPKTGLAVDPLAFVAEFDPAYCEIGTPPLSAKFPTINPLEFEKEISTHRLSEKLYEKGVSKSIKVQLFDGTPAAPIKGV